MPTSNVPAEMLYRTSTLIEAFSQIASAPSFLKDQMFPRVVTTSSDLVSVELQRKSEARAILLALQQRHGRAPREGATLALLAAVHQARALADSPRALLQERADARGGRSREPRRSLVGERLHRARRADLASRGVDVEPVSVHG